MLFPRAASADDIAPVDVPPRPDEPKKEGKSLLGMIFPRKSLAEDVLPPLQSSQAAAPQTGPVPTSQAAETVYGQGAGVSAAGLIGAQPSSYAPDPNDQVLAPDSAAQAVGGQAPIPEAYAAGGGQTQMPAADPYGQGAAAQPPAPDPYAQPAATQAPPSPPPDPAAAEAPVGEPEAEDVSLDAPLRELFTENTKLDPQMESLLESVDQLEASDLAAELLQLAKSIGADGAEARSSD